MDTLLVFTNWESMECGVKHWPGFSNFTTVTTELVQDINSLQNPVAYKLKFNDKQGYQRLGGIET